MTNPDLPPAIRFLSSPAAYPHPAPEIRHLQTHISHVLLAGDYVYKVKKPVNFGFLDFTTLEKRCYFCEQEVVLNRRLCPDLYLGVVAITDHHGVLALDGAGEPVEYAVKMARMDEERMMARVIARGELKRQTIDHIVEILVPFYTMAEGGEAIRAFGSAKAVSVNVLENFEQTLPFVGCEAISQAQFDAISTYARNFLTKEEMFDERIAAGRIHDCHGDLYSANICLSEPIQIYDCIEFNQRFRYCDVASDVAFLAMDLDHHGLPELSDHFIERFCAASRDHTLPDMLNFYKCYRAVVRGKIGLFTAHDPTVDATTKAACLAQAKAYFKLAERYAAP